MIQLFWIIEILDWDFSVEKWKHTRIHISELLLETFIMVLLSDSIALIVVIFCSILTINFGHHVILSFLVSKVTELLNFAINDRIDRPIFPLTATVWNEHESVANCKLKYDPCFLVHFTVWNGLFIAVFIREIYEEAQFIDQYRSAASSLKHWFFGRCKLVRRH